jgi:4-amino-4-deoxychorismate lyase
MKIRVNGRAAAKIRVRDRGLQYGDGVFETMRIRRGQIRLLEFHLDRLYRGLKSLQIEGPARHALRAELKRMAGSRAEAVLKLIVTRGEGPRGYRPTGQERSTRIAMLDSVPQGGRTAGRSARVRMCATRLAAQPRLAGLKTLNRLESVLARSEWRDRRVWEGLMRDADGRIVCGTMSNLFVRSGRRLMTPPLDRCGVAGIMRRWIVQNAKSASLKVSERRIAWTDLEAAEEVFLTNAVVGVMPVAAIEWRGRATLRYVHSDAAAQFQALLERL